MSEDSPRPTPPPVGRPAEPPNSPTPRDRPAPPQNPVPPQRPAGPPPAPWEIGQNTWEPPRQAGAAAPPPGGSFPPQAPPPPQPGPYGAQTGSYSQPSPYAQPNPYAQPSSYAQPGGYEQPGAYSQRPDTSFEVREPSDIGRKIGIGLLCVAFVFLGWWIAYELIPGSVSPPSGFTKFKSSDNRFAIDQPLGWDVTSNPVDPNSDSTMGSALFRSGSAKINITSDTVGDIKGQVLLYSSNVLPPDFSSDPADALHDLMKSRIAATMKNYVEQPAITVDTNFGTARVSEFTGVGGLFGLGGPMHGYRASVSDGQCGFEIVEQCPEKSWSGMSQPFRNVIQSIGPADGSAFTPPPSSGSPMPGIPAIPGAAPTPSQPAPPSSAQNDYGARRFEGANGYGGGGNGGRGGGGYGGGNAAGADNGASNPAGAAGYGGGSSDDTDTGQ